MEQNNTPSLFRKREQFGRGSHTWTTSYYQRIGAEPGRKLQRQTRKQPLKSKNILTMFFKC